MYMKSFMVHPDQRNSPKDRALHCYHWVEGDPPSGTGPPLAGLTIKSALSTLVDERQSQADR